MSGLSTNELTALAYKKVKEMILSQQLKPGQKIIQDNLALELGISRTPLRSALQMLEAEYLIKSIPRKGVVVRKFTSEKILEIYDCRIALEGTAIRLFTETVSKTTINKLKRFFSSFRQDPKSIDTSAYQKEDAKFHDFIVAHCGNNFLTRLFQQGNLLVCIHQIGLVRPPEETLPEHIEIINAIVKRDIDLAEQLGKKHLIKSKELIFERMKKNNKGKEHT